MLPSSTRVNDLQGFPTHAIQRHATSTQAESFISRSSCWTITTNITSGKKLETSTAQPPRIRAKITKTFLPLLRLASCYPSAFTAQSSSSTIIQQPLPQKHKNTKTFLLCGHAPAPSHQALSGSASAATVSLTTHSRINLQIREKNKNIPIHSIC